MIVQSTASKEISVRRYSEECLVEWNEFLGKAKNSTFLFDRNYLEYHSDRFPDHSMMVYQGEELVALFPAHLRADGTLSSHEGLTYGGLVVRRGATLIETLTYFHALLRDLNERQITNVRYKQIPRFYNVLPDDEISYALFLLEARLYRRDCAAVVPLKQSDRLPLRKGHHSTIVKASKQGVRIVQEESFQPFWEQVLTPRLESRYGVKPVHTLAEIALLAARFPDQIKQFSAYRGTEILAGMTIYETPTVAHAQYCSATEAGRKIGAQTFLAQSVIEHYQDKQYFDFGISNENGGKVLNQGLQEWKEGFGARTISHDFFEIRTERYTNLETVINPEPKFGLPPLALLAEAPERIKMPAAETAKPRGFTATIAGFFHLVTDAVSCEWFVCAETFFTRLAAV